MAGRAPRVLLVRVASVAALVTSLILPVGLTGIGPGNVLLTSAAAYAVPSPTAYAKSPGLPDARVYEQVSPPSKTGNYVASGGTRATEGAGYAAAAAGGEALAFLGSGALGNSASSVLGPYVARRGASGWTTSSATSPQLDVTSAFGSPTSLVPSADFSQFAFGAFRGATRYSPEQPAGPAGSVNLYLTTDPFAAPVWLGKPAIESSIPLPGQNRRNDFLIAGASPSLSTVYFEFSGTLVAEDESRAPNVGNGTGAAETAPWGFYEWNEGALSSAGILPSGSASPFGAVPAALAGDRHSPAGWQAEDFNNEVSSDGSRAFFVSPDPVASTVTSSGSCEEAEEEEEGTCSTEAPQLYVRETAPGGAKSTILISQSQLPGHLGEPSPTGPVAVADAPIQNGGPRDVSYVYGAADGKQAFFASRDRLTTSAPEDASPKEYRFELSTGTLTYLPGVVGPIVSSARDGSSFIFKNTATSPLELDLWREGTGGGRITQIAQLPEPTGVGSEEAPYLGHLGVEARASTGGSVYVFDTNSPIEGGFNNQFGYGELYRYDVASDALTCVSCAPTGVTETGHALISYDNNGGSNDKPRSTFDTRVISSDGSRVFFDTPDALVPWDSNGKRDVYEWDNGTIYLLSSGTSTEDAFYLDNSESGNDVFFNTTEGLVPIDADGAYDAYDARVPRPGDRQPLAEPCQLGDCQSPPSGARSSEAPASAAFEGLGNLTPVGESPSPGPKALTRAQKLAKALAACRKKAKRKRRSCQAHARKLYGAQKASIEHGRRGK